MKATMRHLATGLALLLAGAGGAYAQNEGVAARGHDLAVKVCAECHGVEKGYQPSPEPFAPTFEAVANSPGMSPLAMSVFLQTPHATMPNLVLTATERADVVAYISSLKK